MATSEFDSLAPELAFTRRGFMVTALGAGFALAVQPSLAQTAISTDSKGLMAGVAWYGKLNGEANPNTGSSKTECRNQS